MKAITTKFLSATNFKGARIKASDNDGNGITISYPYEFSGAAVYAQAAIALCKKMGWTGTLISGSTQSGYVFVFSDSDRFEIK